MSAAKLVMVIEDDAAIRRGIVDALRFDGYDVMEADRGDKAMELSSRSACDLVLLDLVMPGPDGLEVLRWLRQGRPKLPVIILTAKGDEADRVRGLRLGADDYVVKPFSVRELLARVEAVLRRAPETPPPLELVIIPEGVIDLTRREVRHHDGSRCDLSELETNLVRFLASREGETHSREEILRQVWGLDPEGLATRTIDMHVARLREKLRDPSQSPQVLITVRGKGYMFSGSNQGYAEDNRPSLSASLTVGPKYGSRQ